MIPSTDGAKHSAPHTPSGRRLNHSSPAPWGPLAALILCLSALSACHGDCPAASVGEGTAATSQGGETQAGTSPGPAEGTQSRAEGSGLPGDTTGSREGSSTADPGQNQPPLGPENLPWLGTLTYSHPERLDFSKSTEMEIRSVTFTKLDLSSGETLRILSPELFGEDADQYFYWEAFEVAPTPFDEDVPIDNDWSSKSMKSVKSLRFDVTYLPPSIPHKRSRTPSCASSSKNTSNGTLMRAPESKSTSRSICSPAHRPGSSNWRRSNPSTSASIATMAPQARATSCSTTKAMAPSSLKTSR